MLLLRQSTAKAVSFGCFVDPADGVTLVVGLVSAIDHASTGIKLSKNGGALTIRHASVTASTYDGYGNYIVTLDTTDTNTLGSLRMQFAAAASCMPVWMDFMVLPADVYDMFVAGTGLGVGTVSASVNDAAATVLSFVGASTLSATDNIYVNSYLIFTSGALKGLARMITGYNGTTKVLSFTEAWPAAAANAATFSIGGHAA